MTTINSSAGRTLEYVIVVYAQGKVITLIGFADWQNTVMNFKQACEENSANWAYLINAENPGKILAEYHIGQYSGLSLQPSL